MKKFLDIVTIVLCLVIVVAYVAFEIYIFMTYGNKPIQDVPMWVTWFLWERE